MSENGASIRRHVAVGLLAAALLVGGVGGWAAYASLAGAVIAGGRIVVDSEVKQIQHPYGGIVARITVDDGDRVKAGDLLFALDETITRAERAIIEKRLGELHARRLRLIAERDGISRIDVPDAPVASASIGGAAALLTAAIPEASLEGERRLLKARRAAREGQVAQLNERILQLREEQSGLDWQIAGKNEEIGLVEKELQDLSTLLRKGLVQVSKITALKRERARLVGERGALVAAKAQAGGQITETELQILQIGQDLQTEVVGQLRELEAQIAELEERKVASVEKLERIEVTAPIEGVVHESALHTIGGVVEPAKTVMKIVPTGDELTIEARVAPQNIDQIVLGQAAIVRLTAFNQRTTPELEGSVTRVAATSSRDERTGETFFTVRIGLPEAETARLAQDIALVPGMPVEAFIQTAERTALSYLMKPLSDQIRHALREE